MKNNVLKLLGLIAVSTLGQFPVYSVNSITHIETLVSKGWITLGDASSLSGTTNIPSAGGVTIGYFSSSAPSDSTIASWVLANTASNNIVGNLVSNSWVDIRTIIATGAVMQATGDWDWPGGGNPGTAGTKIGGTFNWIYDATKAGVQLYLFGFNGGSSGFGYSGTTTVGASSSAFDSNSFTGSTEWVALRATNWLLPASDGTAIELKIADVDTSSELIVGTDTGDNTFRDVRMSAVPEPSTGALMLIGAFGLVAMRRLRKA